MKQLLKVSSLFAATCFLLVGCTDDPSPRYINEKPIIKTDEGAVEKNVFVDGVVPGEFVIDTIQHHNLINGKDTISIEYKYANFSQGNLQYCPSCNVWRFAENQYDLVGDATAGNVLLEGIKSNNELIAKSYAGWIDLFAWGAMGKELSPVATAIELSNQIRSFIKLDTIALEDDSVHLYKVKEVIIEDTLADTIITRRYNDTTFFWEKRHWKLVKEVVYDSLVPCCYAGISYIYHSDSIKYDTTVTDNGKSYCIREHRQKLVTMDTVNLDWGYNAITNGGNVEGKWRTMTIREWQLFLKYNHIGAARIKDVNGIIIFPKEATLPQNFVESYHFEQNSGYIYYAYVNNLSIDEWRIMEKNGAIFLPAAGYRDGTKFHDFCELSMIRNGYYWSFSLANDNGTIMNGISFSPHGHSVASNPCEFGCAVRLIQDIK